MQPGMLTQFAGSHVVRGEQSAFAQTCFFALRFLLCFLLSPAYAALDNSRDAIIPKNILFIF